MQGDADPNRLAIIKAVDLCFVVAMPHMPQPLLSYEQRKLPGRVKKPCGGTMVNMGTQCLWSLTHSRIQESLNTSEDILCGRH